MSIDQLPLADLSDQTPYCEIFITHRGTSPSGYGSMTITGCRLGQTELINDGCDIIRWNYVTNSSIWSWLYPNRPPSYLKSEIIPENGSTRFYGALFRVQPRFETDMVITVILNT